MRTVVCGHFPLIPREQCAHRCVPRDSESQSEFGISSPRLKKKNTTEKRFSMNYSVLQVSFRAKNFRYTE